MRPEILWQPIIKVNRQAKSIEIFTTELKEFEKLYETPRSASHSAGERCK